MPPPMMAIFMRDFRCNVSFGGDVLALDQLGPALGVLLDQAAKLFGGAGRRVHALGLESGLYLRRRQDVPEFPVEAADELGRGARRREDAVPHANVDLPGLRFGEGGYLGQQRMALFTAYAQRDH